jgi:peptidoglycan/xylan/chitin deacetylase (PgdA/CDA1 family)
VASGSEVIGHSWNHADLSGLSAAAVATQISDTSAAIREATGIQPAPVFRPPYGSINTRMETAATQLGYGLLLWTIDPKDWHYRDADHIYKVIMEHAKDGSVVVLHDIFPETVRAMERVIPRLIGDGFDLVTVSELLTHHFGEIVPGTTYRGVR